MSLAFRYIALSDTGRQRQNNQDAVKIFALSGEEIVGVLCDGMGGHFGGELAAHTAVEEIEKWWKQGDAVPNPETDAAHWKAAFAQADRQISKHAESDPKLSMMGTTCVTVLLSSTQQTASWANIGDSRLYLWREGQLLQISQDHSLVQRLRREGRITEQEAQTHPQKHLLEKVLSASTSQTPDTGILELKAGDKILLCSDGLYGMLPDPDIEELLSAIREDIEETAMQLIQQANLAGGHDNISVLLIEAE